MTHSYELNEKDICDIIAEKFNCKPENVYIRAVKEYVLCGSTETVIATVRIQEANNKLNV